MITVWGWKTDQRSLWLDSDKAFQRSGCDRAWVAIGPEACRSCVAHLCAIAGKGTVSARMSKPETYPYDTPVEKPDWIFLMWDLDPVKNADDADLARHVDLDDYGQAGKVAPLRFEDWPYAWQQYVERVLRPRVERLHNLLGRVTAAPPVRRKRAMAAPIRLSEFWWGRRHAWIGANNDLEDIDVVLPRLAFNECKPLIQQVETVYHPADDGTKPLWGTTLDTLVDNTGFEAPSTAAWADEFAWEARKVDKATREIVRAVGDAWMRLGRFPNLAANRDDRKRSIRVDPMHRPADLPSVWSHILVVDDFYPLNFPLFDAMVRRDGGRGIKPWDFGFLAGLPTWNNGKVNMDALREELAKEHLTNGYAWPFNVVLLDADLGWQGPGNVALRYFNALEEVLHGVPIVILSRHPTVVTRRWFPNATICLCKHDPIQHLLDQIHMSLQAR